MQDLQNIHPMTLIEIDEEHYEIYFPADIRHDIFSQTQIDITGYAWVDLIEFFLEEHLPHLRGELRYDPDAETCTIQGDFENIKTFALEFRPFFFDDDLLLEFLENMEDAWY